MLLNEPVCIALTEDGDISWHAAVVVGRTIEAEPHYDVRLQDGMILAGVPQGFLRPIDHMATTA
jgi:hypothetical protein